MSPSMDFDSVPQVRRLVAAFGVAAVPRDNEVTGVLRHLAGAHIRPPEKVHSIGHPEKALSCLIRVLFAKRQEVRGAVARGRARHDTLRPAMKIKLEASKIRERDLNLLEGSGRFTNPEAATEVFNSCAPAA